LTQELIELILSRSNVTVAQWRNGAMAQWRNGAMAQWRVYLCLATVGPSHLNGVVELQRHVMERLFHPSVTVADKLKDY
jgi:hypothetical protein